MRHNSDFTVDCNQMLLVTFKFLESSKIVMKNTNILNMTTGIFLISSILLIPLAGKTYYRNWAFAIETNQTHTNGELNVLKTNLTRADNHSITPDVSINPQNNRMDPDTFGTNSSDEQSSDHISSVVKELTGASSSKILNYPITDLAPEDIVKVLNKLPVTDLYKVLSEINQNSFTKLINEKLSPGQVNQVIARLPPDEQHNIENRVAT